MSLFLRRYLWPPASVSKRQNYLAFNRTTTVFYQMIDGTPRDGNGLHVTFELRDTTLPSVALHTFFQAQCPRAYLSAEADLAPRLVPLWNRLSLPRVGCRRSRAEDIHIPRSTRSQLSRGIGLVEEVNACSSKVHIPADCKAHHRVHQTQRAHSTGPAHPHSPMPV